jgi:hypothetical protein
LNKFLPLAAMLTALPIALVAVPAAAEDWHELAVTGDAIGYGDADSIAAQGDEVSARVMLGLREAMGKHANIEFLVSSVRFSCGTGQYFVDAVSGLDGERATVASLPGSREWKQVGEGTLYASFRDFACGTAAARPVADPYRASAEFWRPDEEMLEAGTIELASQFYAG